MGIPEGHSREKNIVNFLLMILVSVPWILAVYHVAHCDPNAPRGQAAAAEGEEDRSIGGLIDQICPLALDQPLVFLNLLFLVAICLLFWLFSLLQHSTWLIDPYWTFIPLMISHYYQFHPLANFDDLRSKVALGLIYFWSIRLTHSYFRREEWNFGAREDWRFSEFYRQYPQNWWWMSFFVCYLSQQIFLIGITLPMFAVFTNPLPWNHWDLLASILAVVGVVGAYFADTQLRNFMLENENRKKRNLTKMPLLNSGLFYYSRHPNYFFEQVFWWALYIFAWNLGFPWMALGPLSNSLCLIVVTFMVEAKMLRDKSREQILLNYYKTTSAIIPMFKFKLPEEKSD